MRPLVKVAVAGGSLAIAATIATSFTAFGHGARTASADAGTAKHTAGRSAAAVGAPAAIGAPVYGAISALSAPTSTPLPPATAAAAETIAARLTATPAGVADDFLPGSGSASAGRLLLSHLGSQDLSLFAFATSKHRVCLELLRGSDGGGGGCASNFLAGAPVTLTLVGVHGAGETGDAPLYAYGLASDDVTAIDYVLDGQTSQATLANNAFFFEAPDATTPGSALQSITAVLRDGSRVAVPLPPLPPATG